MNRREFILSASAFSLASCVHAQKVASTDKKHDESLAVIVSDCHICGDKKWHANDEMVKTLNQILALDPLPAKMIVMGDIAALVGLKKDYIEAKKVFKPIVDAGIEISWMMGNHDRRDVFAEVFRHKIFNATIQKLIVFTFYFYLSTVI
jgi:3',5'-cyclic AMP phosphodiesterase CpdA